ncbi:DUF4350 domain-containing protein [Frankia nepalensis]|uniref:DUF4350 domain-containing protein n=1 Tax=Frankia nepalensis TaxID=1836974 RepID=UPI00396A3E50
MTADEIERRVAEALAGLDLADRIRLLTGASFWRTRPAPGIGLRSVVRPDGPAGVRGERADEREPSACLPCPSALAATWDEALLRRVGGLLAAQARAKGVDVVLGPTVNLHRSPLGGRHFECLSEDPLLTARMAGALVAGLQAGGVAATVKHYVANESETDRFTVDARVDERALREVYLAPFEALVTEHRAWAVMAAYNSVGGVTMTENPLLRDPLQDEWGFDGLVVSDWIATRSTVPSALAGLDLVMPGPLGPWGPALVAAVRAGQVPAEVVEDKARRLLRLAARVGALKGPSASAPPAGAVPAARAGDAPVPAGPAGGPGPGGSTFQRSGPRPATTRRALRVLAVFAVLIVGYAVLAAAVGGPSTSEDYLDVRSPKPGGTMALAEILRDRGVEVVAGGDVASALDASRAPDGASDPDRTVVVVEPGLLDRFVLRDLRDLAQGGADVVLVEPSRTVLSALRLPIDVLDSASTASNEPDCALPEARTAGSVTIGSSYLYGPPEDDPVTPPIDAEVTYCYPLEPGSQDTQGAAVAVVTQPGGSGRLVLLGGGEFLTNDQLDEDGDAALAFGLMAKHPRLDWVIQQPTSSEPVEGMGAVDLLGDGFWLTVTQLLLALLLLALWRGRRLGPPVPEPLPVVVRAAETTEGRGRLYATARARDLAAESLRAGLRARLADRLGLPPHGQRGAAGTVRAGAVAAEITGPDPASLIASVAERTGRPAMEIWALLYGSGGQGAPMVAPPPSPGGWPHPGPPGPGQPELDDAALLWLAEALDDLDRQVGGR